MKFKKFVLILFVFLLLTSRLFAEEKTLYGKVPDFVLTSQQGSSFGLLDLKGKVWISDFIFTSCQSQCPLMTRKMADLQKKLSAFNVIFVSFSVDPEHDSPAVLTKYAEQFGANQKNWFFLTGKKEMIWNLATDGFQLGVGDATKEEIEAGAQPVLHSERFILVDGNGAIHGYYDSSEPLQLEKLASDAVKLSRKDSKVWIKKLPALNAGLNLTSALLIIMGLFLIKQHAWTGHALCMCLAMLVSSIFLISYLYYHFHAGHVRFPHPGPIRYLYFAILISHTILAITVPPLSIITLYHALRSRFDKHVRIAKIAFPVWLYVSVTGVIVYYMLYQMK